MALVLRIGALGAVAGALAGAVSVSAWVLVFDTHEIGVLPGAVLVAGLLGATFGAVLFPLAGFTVLRITPLWRILMFTGAGAALGGVVGLQSLHTWWLLWPVAGFVASVLWLSAEARRAARRRSD